MTNPIFDLRAYENLPLWAQALLAGRIARRAAGRAAPQTRDLQVFIQACEAIERAAVASEISRDDRAILKHAMSLHPSGDAVALSTAIYYACDAAFAAEASTDFAAAEAACTRSAGEAMVWAGEADGMTSLQTRIYLAADVDLLQFACGEQRIGRYDALTKDVLLRLIPAS